jgi:primosomal protein N' (replication factor Y)
MPTPTQSVIHVCIPNTHRDYFDYFAVGEPPEPGVRVLVPFGSRQRMGVVVGHAEQTHSDFVIKTILSVLDDAPLLPEPLLKLCRWISEYYQAPLSEVIPLALPKQLREGRTLDSLEEWDYQLAMSPEMAQRLIPARAKSQQAAIALFQIQPTLSKQQLTEAGISSATFNALLKSNMLQTTPKVIPMQIEPRAKPLALNIEQAETVEHITQALDAFHCFLIDGVTGSGKTEVYLQVIATVLAAGKQVLILVPEIGLTPQLLSRFTARFHEPMAVMHSHLNDTERRRAWLYARDARVKLVIGTRGAVFTPMPDLGLIVIDEEHDASFKQMDRVRYSARDTAMMRAYFANIPIILGSATPSLESLHNSAQGKYRRLALIQKAVSRVPLRYQLLDIRNETLHEGLAQQTLHIIREHIEKHHQVLVFINRRGFSPILLCHQCGWMADCRACDAHLTMHRTSRQLACHHCGLIQAIPQCCGQCGATELIPIGAGTQRIYDYLTTQFPETNILRIDRDEVQKKHALDNCLDKINRGEAQLIVGTQMLAKGHHFPNLTLVVVVDADNGFYNQDFRAIERLGQLLTQVAGRAGREENPGHVVIQTHFPQHPLLNLLVQQGYGPFADSLLNLRQQALLPPFSHMAMLRAQSKTLAKVLQFLHAIKQQLHPIGLELLGPAPAPLARKANYHRMQLLIQSPTRLKREHALRLMREAIRQHKLDNSIEWTLDVDPMDLS